MDAEDERYDTSNRRKETLTKEDWLKKTCVGSGLCAILASLCALLCLIIAFSINELTQNFETARGGIDLACGWNKPVNLDGKNGDITFAELCDNCADSSCAACTNKVRLYMFQYLFIISVCVCFAYLLQFGGEIWLLCGLLSFFLCIICIVFNVIFWFCYDKCSCLNCWLKLMYGACVALTLTGVISYVFITDCEQCCYDHTEGNEPKVLGSQWAGAIAAVFQIIAVVTSCGLGSGFDD